MRAHRVLGLGFVTALTLLVACTSTDNHEITECADAAVPEASAVDVDAGPTTPVHPPVTSPVLHTLQTVANVELIGITTNATPYAVYWIVHYGINFTDPRTWDSMAAPIWGGDPVTIVTGLDDDDPAVVDGGAVAWWTTTSSDNLAATSIGIWTPDRGPQVAAVAVVRRPLRGDGGRLARRVQRRHRRRLDADVRHRAERARLDRRADSRRERREPRVGFADVRSANALRREHARDVVLRRQ